MHQVLWVVACKTCDTRRSLNPTGSALKLSESTMAHQLVKYSSKVKIMNDYYKTQVCESASIDTLCNPIICRTAISKPFKCHVTIASLFSTTELFFDYQSNDLKSISGPTLLIHWLKLRDFFILSITYNSTVVWVSKSVAILWPREEEKCFQEPCRLL
jgi:hypothetical protein